MLSVMFTNYSHMHNSNNPQYIFDLSYSKIVSLKQLINCDWVKRTLWKYLWIFAIVFFEFVETHFIVIALVYFLNIYFTCHLVLLGSSKNAFIMQSKSTFLEFLRDIHRYKFGPPKKVFRGEIIQGEWRNFHRARALFLTGVEFHALPLRLGVLPCRVGPSLRV